MTKQYRKYKNTAIEELTKLLTELTADNKKKRDIIYNINTDKKYAKILNEMVYYTEKEIEAINKILNERN